MMVMENLEEIMQTVIKTNLSEAKACRSLLIETGREYYRRRVLELIDEIKDQRRVLNNYKNVLNLI